MHVPASMSMRMALLDCVGPISRTFLPLLRDRDVCRAVEMKENVNELFERYPNEYGRRRMVKLLFPQKGWGRPLLSFSFSSQTAILSRGMCPYDVSVD